MTGANHAVTGDPSDIVVFGSDTGLPIAQPLSDRLQLNVALLEIGQLLVQHDTVDGTTRNALAARRRALETHNRNTQHKIGIAKTNQIYLMFLLIAISFFYRS